ncbi:MAG: response regulator [Gemmatimonadota bacterium]|nr:response regulator [Gemmatimonadota bacterium]
MPSALTSPLDPFQCTFYPVQVLVVDDDVTTRAAMRRVLEHQGYSVIVAEDAYDALRVLQSTHVPVDLLVTDVQMPGMRGDTLARRVRESCPDLPVLFVSGEPSFATLPEQITGQACFLEKPFLPGELIERVQRLLGLTPAQPTEHTQPAAGFGH